MKKLSKSKIFTLFAVLSLMLVMSVTTTYAHFFPIDGARWVHTEIDNNDDMYCDVSANGDYLNDNWEENFGTALSHWNGSYSDWNVVAGETSFSYSNFDYSTLSSWPSTWGSSTVARTFVQDTDDVWYQDDPGNFNGEIDYVWVKFNPAYNDFDDEFMRVLIMAHEFGHGIALGHPEAGTVSIMTQSQDSWDYPQDHDRDDLNEFYP